MPSFLGSGVLEYPAIRVGQTRNSSHQQAILSVTGVTGLLRQLSELPERPSTQQTARSSEISEQCESFRQSKNAPQQAQHI